MIQINKWIEETFALKTVRSVPIMTHPGIELCNRTVKEAVTDGEIHAKAIQELNNKYPADACTVIMDLTVEAESFGADVVFPEDEVPSVTGRLLTGYDSVKALQIPPLTAARVPEFIKANRLSAEYIQDKPIFGGCIGPFSLAGRLFDLTELMMAIYVEPETVSLLLQKCTQFLINYCLAIKETGVNGLIIAEPAAGLISNDDCKAYSSVYVKLIVEAVQNDSFLVVLHNCGNAGHCTEAMVESGAKGLHFGNKIDMVEALKGCPKDRLVMGNLDPVGLFKQGTAGEVKQATRELLTQTAGWNNYILSTGCDIPPHIPFENIEAFYEVLKEYNLSVQ